MVKMYINASFSCKIYFFKIYNFIFVVFIDKNSKKTTLGFIAGLRDLTQLFHRDSELSYLYQVKNLVYL